MTHLSNTVSRGVRLCLGVLVGALGGMSVATAQQAPQGDASSQLEEVVVTGTRIRRAQLSLDESTLPYAVVGREELEGRQVVNLIDALRDLTFASVTSNRGPNTQYGDNYAFINLLGLGSQRTVTLLNGRRVVGSNQGTVFVPGNATGSQVDLSIINPLLIERVDLITGSGGAVYGADAIGGVVNLITRSNYEGLNIDASFGTTAMQDGDNYRLSGLWGLNFADGRGNLTVSGDYSKGDVIVTDNRDPRRYLGSAAANVFNGAQRNPAAFSASSAVSTLLAGQALPATFLPSASDGIRSTVFGPLSLATTVHSHGGVLHTGLTAFGNYGASGGSSSANMLPTTPIASAANFRAADSQGFGFFAPSALTATQTCSASSSACLSIINTLAPGTPLAGMTAAQLNSLALQLLQRNRPTINEYFQANPGVSPLLAVGYLTGPIGHYATVANTNSATRTLFPTVAVPLQFDASGNLVPFNIGDLSFNGQSRYGSAFGGDGYDSYAEGHQQIRAGAERASVFLQSRFNFSESVRTRGEYFYSKNTFDSVGAAPSNSPFGSSTGGSYSVPIYIDQNPYLNSSAKATIASLVSQGWAPGVLNGNRLFYLGKSLIDLYGGPQKSGNEVETWRVAQALEGEFDLLDRELYWELAAGYGKAEARNFRMDVLDIEFALATDVVADASGKPVCRQQTLAAPERVDVRNPLMAFLNLQPDLSRSAALTPTAAQISACKPMNLFGPGNISQEARDYVLADSGGTNENTQTFYSFNMGTDLYELPSGGVSVNVQAETRTERIAFLPGESARIGSGRTTTVLSNQGELSFDEYGAEMIIPLLGREWSFPFARALELNGAYRVVERSGKSPSPFYTTASLPKEDEVYQYGLRWKPFDDLTLRYNFSTSVRSPSLVELFTPAGSGFVQSAGNVCAGAASLAGGPNPEVRKRNCIAAVKTLGIATTDEAALAFLTDPVTVSNVLNTSARPAGTLGNPDLFNEQGETWSVGFTYEPEWLENFVLAADYIALDASNQVSFLTATAGAAFCFDSPDYPNVIIGGTPACDMAAFGVRNPANPNQFIIPSINPITGNPVFVGQPRFAPTGPAVIQYPMATAFYEYRNTNFAKTELRSTNFNLRYRFGLDKLFGEFFDNAGTWGDIGLSANVYWIKRYDSFTGGTSPSDRLVGDSFPELQGRFEISHRVGRFAHALQISAINRTVGDNSIAPTYNEYSPTFVIPGYEYYNYYASYLVNNNTTVRFSVANLTDTAGPSLGQYGVSYDGGIGREFTLGVNVRF